MRALKGDLAGGVSAGVLTIPVSMGYGILALQPLGDAYVSYGVIAGLVSAIVALLAGAMLGGSAGLMYTPRSVVTLIMAAVVLEGVVRGPAAVAARGDIQQTLTLVFFVVVAAGIFQALFGALRLGGLIRYIPSPVMAGFQNAVALLIIAAQVDTLLGFRRHVPLGQLASNLALVQPPTLAVGLVTFLATWYGARLTKRVPPVILGLLVGSGAYYARCRSRDTAPRLAGSSGPCRRRRSCRSISPGSARSWPTARSGRCCSRWASARSALRSCRPSTYCSARG